jgi:hypothetical protein
LVGHEFREHGVFFAEDIATSALLPRFQAPVKELFAKCDEADQI